MRGRQSVAEIMRRHEETNHRVNNGFHSWVLPTAMTPPLFVSRLSGCLTHRTRYATWNDRPWGQSMSFHGECGVMMSKAVAVDPRDEVFLCHACFDACERYGIPHFNLVPASGCEVSNGRRGKTTRRKSRRSDPT